MAYTTEALKTLGETVLDRSVLFSFDQSGYRRHARRFVEGDEREMAGQVCLVTGANSGLGKATALALASRGAEVWMLCRDEVRGQAARDGIVAATGNEAVHLALVDMADQASLRRFADGFDRSRVDVLVHNAGVLPDERQETADGLELTVATNLAGPFLLSALLRQRLLASPDSRVIHVTSGGMYPRRLSVKRLSERAARFDGVTAYADTKRALVVLTELLADRLEGTSVRVHSTHPGWADTPAVRTSLPRFWRMTRKILRSPAQGADTVVWLATSRRAGQSSGELWFDRESQPTHLLPWTRETEAERSELWRALCDWTGLEAELDWKSKPEEETGDPGGAS